MDTKFSVALHILAFISETDEEANSTTLANSVNTNSSHIRKITALLKKARQPELFFRLKSGNQSSAIPQEMAMQRSETQTNQFIRPPCCQPPAQIA